MVLAFPTFTIIQCHIIPFYPFGETFFLLAIAITITVTVIAMAAFTFFQGQVGIGAAIPIIAVAGVVCLTLTLGFSGIKKLFEDSTDKVKNLIDNDQQKTSDQPEHKNPPNSRMSDTHIEPHEKPQGRTT
jgi:hypothetical protein